MARNFDYIVVGAGSAGAVVAARLSEDPAVSVLLLEAGGWDRQLMLRMPLGFHSTRYPETNWHYETEPEPHLGGRVLPLPRGKVIGGSSTVNAMVYSRGHPRDYDLWRQAGCTGWSHAEVLPYFKRSEANFRGAGPYHGGDGPMAVSRMETSRLLYEPVAEAARRLGYAITEDHHGAEPEGFGKAEATTGKGRRASTARAFLYPARRRPNFTIELGALTTRVLIENGRATGVEYRRNGERQTARAAREIVLAGGAYNSPQLLMLSGIGPADELRRHGIPVVADLPGVGRNLSEHAAVFIHYATSRPVSLLNELRFDRVAVSLLRWLAFGTGVFASQGTSCHALIRTRPELERPDIQIFFNPVRLDARVWFPGIRPVQQHQINATIILLHPESRGRLRLRSADPMAPPRIVLNLLAERGDAATLIRGLRAARRVYATEPLAGLVARELAPGAEAASDEALDAYLRRSLVTSHHPVGTCSMGEGPNSVVDPQLRVRGIAALRVADASIMPTVPGGNTNAPAIMVGEKAADLIRGRALPPATAA